MLCVIICPYNSSQFVFAEEDCTSVIPKVTYDATLNSFIGFVPPLKNGLPQVNTFSTESFAVLENWFSTLAKSHLLNVHMIQPITLTSNTCSPFLLSAYGTDSRFKTRDIIMRWIYIINECKNKGIRLIDFATDLDPRYMKAMHLFMGFFARMSNQQLHHNENSFYADIPRVSSILTILIFLVTLLLHYFIVLVVVLHEKPTTNCVFSG